MKKLTVLVIMLFALQLSAQETITGMEWWLAGEEQNRSFVAINPEVEFDGVVPIDLSSLANGRYQIHFRFKSISAKWSPVLRHHFTKTPEGVSLITAYQYWSDADFEKIVTVDLEQPVNPLEGLVDLDMGDFPVGKQRVYLRFKDSNGQWGSVHSQFITRTPDGDESVYIAAYEYWFNNDQENSLWGFFDHKPSLVDSLIPLDLSSLVVGGHVVSIRFFNNLGQASFTHRSYVKKMPPGLAENLMVAYRYWFNNDVQTLTRIDFDLPLVIQESPISISLDQFNPGEKVLVSLQFLDKLGQWSAIHADSVQIFDPTHVAGGLSDGENRLLVYPNPGRGRVYVEWLGGTLQGNPQLYLVDLNGREMARQEVVPDEYLIPLNLEGLSRGVYLVVLTVEGTRYTRRLVVIE